MKSRNRKSPNPEALVLALVITLAPTWACGPFFPNSMLPGGDATLLQAPISDFQVELDHIRVPGVSFTAVVSTNQPTQQTVDAELADLQAAVSKSGLMENDAARLCLEFQAARQTLQLHAEARELRREQEAFHDPAQPADPRPEPIGLALPSGLPGEFADYLTGSIAFHSGDTNRARVAWEKLLARPAAERRYRSTWAAFMLGKTWLISHPEKAVTSFRQVRALAQAGFHDSLGLAADSYGWEAKAELNWGNYAPALHLYLSQYQTGDPTALVSLRMTMRKVIGQADQALPKLAPDPLAQRIVTAYLISRRGLIDLDERQTTELTATWLEAVEAAGVRDMESADRLAVAAYQRGLFEMAGRWLQRASATSAMAQWLRAKLLLRAGKVEPAARLLSQVVRLFPREGDWAEPPTRERIYAAGWSQWDEDSPLRQAMGELGVLHLTRRQFYEALDTLLHAGYWSDAACVAECVLTPDELMAYVDRQWPEPDTPQGEGGHDSQQTFGNEGLVRPDAITVEIRYLVARRLARLQRWDEAADFYPPKWKARCGVFVQALQSGRNPNSPVVERAQALWSAAQIARHEGMELFGTEVEPDWHLFDGQFEWDTVSILRSRPPAADGTVTWPENGQWNSRTVDLRVSASTLDEQRRLREHRPNPDLRFHYRYYAANLAWEASQLMPDNTDETARVLWTAGRWLKGRDPKAADRFYKALVRRCGETTLGQEADRLRWFPKTDQPQPPPLSSVSEETTEPAESPSQPPSDVAPESSEPPDAQPEPQPDTAPAHE